MIFLKLLRAELSSIYFEIDFTDRALTISLAKIAVQRSLLPQHCTSTNQIPVGQLAVSDFSFDGEDNVQVEFISRFA